jgi:hypothetical protein
VLSNNTTTSLVNCDLANNTIIGGIIRYTVVASDGTNLQSESGIVGYNSYNKAGTTFSASATAMVITQKASSGTLTVTWSMTGANPSVIQINANSTLSPSAGYPRVTYSIENFGNQNITTQ